MDYTGRDALDAPSDSSSEGHVLQGEASTSNRNTYIEHGPGPNIGLERSMPQAVTLSQVLGSRDSTIPSSTVPAYFTFNNEIERPISSFSDNNNSASSETLFQDARLENAYHDFSLGVDFDFPILTGEPVVEVDFEMLDGMLATIGESPASMSSLFNELPKADIEALEPTAFSMNTSVNPPSAPGQSTINHLNASQPEVGATTSGSSVPSSHDPQRMNGIANTINTFSRHPNRVKPLAPKQLPIYRTYPPESRATRNKHRFAFPSYIVLIHTGLGRIMVKSVRPAITEQADKGNHVVRPAVK